MHNIKNNARSEKKKLSPPVFIVGAPRSGTTLLAVLLDRHSNIAIGPETQFFTEFIPRYWENRLPETHEELVDSALQFKRIADFELDRDELLRYFKNYELSFANLLRAIIEVYALQRSKSRPGEKSPLHLNFVPALLEQFPGAKIICILRDGRDVVRSLLNVPWAIPDNPRRLGLFCIRWNDSVEEMLKYEQVLSPDVFMTVKFEDILRQPKLELEKICDFIGEEFEPAQLETAQPSSTVPEWEKDWKNKASETIDAGRIEAWRKSSDKKQFWIMNSMMGPLLKRLGYRDTASGTVVFPDAALKVFLTARPEVRAARRAAEVGGDVAAIAADIAPPGPGRLHPGRLAAGPGGRRRRARHLGPDPRRRWSIGWRRTGPGTGSGCQDEAHDRPSGAEVPPGTRTAARPGAPGPSTPWVAACWSASAGCGYGYEVEGAVEGARRGSVHPGPGAPLQPRHARSWPPSPVVRCASWARTACGRRTGVFAWVLSALGGLPVARGSADREALRRCQVILEAGQPLVLFPEGTRQLRAGGGGALRRPRLPGHEAGRADRAGRHRRLRGRPAEGPQADPPGQGVRHRRRADPAAARERGPGDVPAGR